jgi:ankyrin repeat protein
MHLDLCKKLLAMGADPNLANYEHFTPLMIAASRGCNLIMELLIENGAKLDYVDKHYGETALIKAIQL